MRHPLASAVLSTREPPRKGTGLKWRLPNLYFLVWLLANDPIVRWIVFIEDRLGLSGAFVGVCDATLLKARIEAVHQEYASVAPQFEFNDPTRVGNNQALANEFNKIRGAVAPPASGELPTLAWLTSAGIRDLLGPYLVTMSIRWSDRLDREGLDAVLSAPIPHVATTTADGRFRGLVEQREIALAFGRRLLRAT